MAQDLGSAILAGIQGAQAMGQQRVRNQLAQEELEQGQQRLGLLQRQVAVDEDTNRRAVEEANRLTLIRDNDQFIQRANAAGFLTSDMLSIDGDKLRRGIESGDRTAIRFGLDLVNKSGELPQGSVADAIQPLPNGGYAISVRNKDGSRGVVTRDGSSAPDSEVVNFDAGALANLGNLYYQTQVASNSSILSPTTYRAQEGRVKADAGRNELLDRINRKRTVLSALPPDGGARRAAASALASAATPEEENQILDALENDLTNAGAIAPRNNQAPAAPSAPRTTPAPSTSAAPPSITERAYSRVKSDAAAVQAVGNGMNKNELTELYMYSLRQGDPDTASRLEPYLVRRHGLTQAELGSIKNQMADVRRVTGENMDIPAATGQAIADTTAAAIAKGEEAATALGFGERAAQQRLTRQADIMADIRGERPSQPAVAQARKNYTLNELSPAEKAAVEQYYRANGMNPVNVFNGFDSTPLAKRKAVFDLIDSGRIKVPGSTTRTSITIKDPAIRSEVRNVAAVVSSRPTSAVDRDINAGRIPISPAIATAVASDLRDKGITDVQGLLRLNDRDRALARAVILATEKDPNVRKQMSEEMSNIFETGNVSISQQQFETAEIDRDRNVIARERNAIDRATLNVRISELRRDLVKAGLERTDKVVDLGAKFIEASNKIFFGEDGTEKNLNRTTAARFTNSIMGPYMYRALNARTKDEGQAALTAMSPALSTTVAALAAEEEGGIIETLVSFFRADAVDTFSSTDFDLARVRVEKDSNGRPTRFYYTDERGAPVDEAVDAKALQNLNGQVYKLVLDAAEYNAKGR